jgi:Tfp pilus assembly protein PilP
LLHKADGKNHCADLNEWIRQMRSRKKIQVERIFAVHCLQKYY